MTDRQRVRRILSEAIEASNGVTLADFMELCLYSPGVGYYERTLRQVGKEGDFYTSVSVGSVYGELLGSMLARELKGQSLKTIQIVEAGVHTGQLALDILAHLERWEPEFFGQVRYLIIEPSSSRRDVQQASLKQFEGKVAWATGWSDVEEFEGAVISNELLDAMPVRSLSRREGAWAERYVIEIDGQLAFEERAVGKQDLPSSGFLDRLEKEADSLPDGFPLEISPQADAWWQAALGRLRQGILFTADYGYSEEEWLEGAFPEGTLRGYKDHRQVTDLLFEPGMMDLTAHVNFSELARMGELAGFEVVELDRQGQVLGRIMRDVEEGNAGFPDWTPKRNRQLQTLIFPQFLGAKFRNLLLKRSCP